MSSASGSFLSLVLLGFCGEGGGGNAIQVEGLDICGRCGPPPPWPGRAENAIMMEKNDRQKVAFASLCDLLSVQTTMSKSSHATNTHASTLAENPCNSFSLCVL
jgi:hypothetical protein